MQTEFSKQGSFIKTSYWNMEGTKTAGSSKVLPNIVMFHKTCLCRSLGTIFRLLGKPESPLSSEVNIAYIKVGEALWIFASCKFLERGDFQEHFPSFQKESSSLDGLSVQLTETH